MTKDYPNLKVRTFPDDVLQAMRKANKEILDEKAAEDPLIKEIIDSQDAYLRISRKWTEISDKAYVDSIPLD